MKKHLFKIGIRKNHNLLLTVFLLTISTVSAVLVYKLLDNFYNIHVQIISKEDNLDTKYDNSLNISGNSIKSIIKKSEATPTPNIFSGFEKDTFYITYYGWPDNTPAGREIAYPSNRYKSTLHNEAGGVGTYQDPITFAAQKNAWELGSIFYVPYLKKYIIYEDWCASCRTDINHIDIWLNSNENFIKEVLDCQNNLTKRNELVIINPTADLAVDDSPLFDINNGNCSFN